MDSSDDVSFYRRWLHADHWQEGAISYNNRTRRADIYNTKGGYDLTFAGPQTATEVEGKIIGAFTDLVRHF